MCNADIPNRLNDSFAFSIEVIDYSKALLSNERLKQALVKLINKKMRNGYLKDMNAEWLSQNNAFSYVDNSLFSLVSDLARSEAGKAQLNHLIKYNRKRDVLTFAERVLLRASVGILKKWGKTKGNDYATLS